MQLTNFYEYLKRKKVLVFSCIQKDGRFEFREDIINPESPCTLPNPFVRRNNAIPTFITLRWDEGFDNGILTYELVEFYKPETEPTDVWVRRSGSGFAFANLITLNEIFEIFGTISFLGCGRIGFQRQRPARGPNTQGLQNGSDRLKISSLRKRDKAIGCQRF